MNLKPRRYPSRMHRPLSNVFIIARSVSVVLDFRQNPPDLPCFKHQAPGAAAAASPPSLCQGHFHALNFLFSVQWNDDIRSLLSPAENRAVQTEWEERIKDGASTQCYGEIQRELMRALDTIYLLYTREGKHNTGRRRTVLRRICCHIRVKEKCGLFLWLQKKDRGVFARRMMSALCRFI